MCLRHKLILKAHGPSSRAQAAVDSALAPKLGLLLTTFKIVAVMHSLFFQLISKGYLGYYYLWSSSITDHKQKIYINSRIKTKVLLRFSYKPLLSRGPDLRLVPPLWKVRKRKDLINKCYRGANTLTPETLFVEIIRNETI